MPPSEILFWFAVDLIIGVDFILFGTALFHCVREMITDGHDSRVEAAGTLAVVTLAECVVLRWIVLYLRTIGK